MQPNTTTTTNSITPIDLDSAIDIIATQMVSQFLTGDKCAQTPIVLGKAGAAKSGQLLALANKVATQMQAITNAPTPPRIYAHLFNLMTVNYQDMVGGALGDLANERLVRTAPDPLVVPPAEILAEYDHIIIIVDEIDKGPDENRQAVSSLLLDNQLGIFDLPPQKFFVVGAGNDTASKSGGVPLFLHNVNRTKLFHVIPSVRRWLNDYSLDPANGIPPMARAFVELNASLFTDPADLPSTPNTPFLTLRSFTNGVRGLPYSLPFNPPLDPRRIDPFDPNIFDAILAPTMRPTAEADLAAVMGSGAANSYLNFARNYHVLPTRAEVLANPDTAKLPTYSQDPSAVHACAAYLLNWLRMPLDTTTNKHKKSELESYGQYAARFDATKRVDLMVSITKLVPQFTVTKAFTDLISDPATKTLVAAAMAR